jgi:hypothetical protein
MQIVLDYPFRPVPRYGHGRNPHPQLYAIIDARRDVFAGHLREFADFRDDLQKIPLDEHPDAPGSPFWNNGFIPGLDAISLYCFLRTGRPRIFCEIGSGHSTRFARRAVQDEGLSTRLVSIDPHPRVEIDALCDVVIRQPAEDVDPDYFNDLRAGDILFIDSSHRSFTNSDVTALYLDVLPRLPPGVVIHLHDVFLPYDYPEEWGDRFYNEQYLLACSRLAKQPSFEILLANTFINCDEQLNACVDDLFDHPAMAEISEHGWIVRSGWSFWLRKL